MVFSLKNQRSLMEAWVASAFDPQTEYVCALIASWFEWREHEGPNRKAPVFQKSFSDD